MENSQVVAIAVGVVVILAAIAWVVYSRRRSRHLRDHFGSEYERAVAERGDRRRAEAELAQREQRIRKLDIRPLSVSDRQRYSQQWMQCQAQFVDDPAGAVSAADELLTEVIRARGYAADNPYDRIADISAAYPQQAPRYRLADELQTRHRRGEGSTEDLRKAFVHYRYIFDEILGDHDEELKRVS
jgi:type VI protein secretion system component VasK